MVWGHLRMEKQKACFVRVVKVRKKRNDKLESFFAARVAVGSCRDDAGSCREGARRESFQGCVLRMYLSANRMQLAMSPVTHQRLLSEHGQLAKSGQQHPVTTTFITRVSSRSVCIQQRLYPHSLTNSVSYNRQTRKPGPVTILKGNSIGVLQHSS